MEEKTNEEKRAEALYKAKIQKDLAASYEFMAKNCGEVPWMSYNKAKRLARKAKRAQKELEKLAQKYPEEDK